MEELGEQRRRALRNVDELRNRKTHGPTALVGDSDPAIAEALSLLKQSEEALNTANDLLSREQAAYGQVTRRMEETHTILRGLQRAKARDENRTIITFDLDFGDLLAAAGIHLPSVVIFRLHNHTPLSFTRKLLENLTAGADQTRNRCRDYCRGRSV